MEKEKNTIYVSPSLKQLVQKHLASYGVLHDGRGHFHLNEAVNILRSIVGEKRIKEKYREEYGNVIKILNEFQKIVFHINAFFSIMEKKDFRDSSFFNKRFRAYYVSLQHLPLIHHKIEGLLCFLLSLTDLADKSIPSSYFSMASQDRIDFKSEEEKRRGRMFIPRKPVGEWQE